MRIRRKRRGFSDGAVASDTVISFILGGISLVVELAGVIASITTKGDVPDIVGVLYICAILLSITGIIFGRIGLRKQQGGMKAKRVSIILNIATLIIPIAIILLGV